MDGCVSSTIDVVQRLFIQKKKYYIIIIIIVIIKSATHCEWKYRQKERTLHIKYIKGGSVAISRNFTDI